MNLPETIFKIYFHIDQLELKITELQPLKTIGNRDVSIQLESLKIKCQALRKVFDKVYKTDSEIYGQMFDELSEILDKNFNIEIIN